MFFADVLAEPNDRTVTAGDIALGGGLVGVAVLSGVYVDDTRPDTIAPDQWWHWLLLVVPPLLVIVRRMGPVPLALIAAAAQAVIWMTGLPDVMLPMVVLLYSASSEGGDTGARVAVGITAVLTAVTAIGVALTDEVTLTLVPLVTLTGITAIVLGINAARQRVLAAELATAVAEARLRSEHDRAAAIADERSHIARELHDSVGHTLSVIAVQAEAAARVAKQKPEAVVDAIGAIATAAREALTDTRRVLAGLRSSAELELAPPRDLDATRQLVERLADAGINASLATSGCDVQPPSPVVARGVYRIVQESLTNAVKHGPPNVRIDVAVDCRPNAVEIRVNNTLRNPARPPDSAGIGLAGMAERAEVLGGTLATGIVGNQFVVHAVLPSDSAQAVQPNGGSVS